MNKRRVSDRVKQNSRVLHRARALLGTGPGKMRDVSMAAANTMNVLLPHTKSACWALLHEFVASRATSEPVAQRSEQEKAERTWKGKCHVKPQDVNSDDFLFSFEWRQLRMRVLTKRGARCECCGASPQDGVTVINVDHVKPRRLFPALALVESNLQVLCAVCNHGKGNWDQTDWRPETVSPVPEDWHVPMWGKPRLLN